MIKKRMIILLIVVPISMAFFGCDLINGAIDSVFLNAPDVSAGDLDGYSSTAVPEGDSDAVAKGFELALAATTAEGQNIMSRVLGDDYEDTVAIMKYASPETAALFSGESASRSITEDVSVVVADEELTESGVTINIDKIDVSGNIYMDSLTEPGRATVDFKALAQVGVENIEGSVYDYDDYTTRYVTINDLKLNINSNGNSTVLFDSSSSPDSITYYLGLDLALGLSLDCEGYSGKYVVNFKYINNGNWEDGDDSYTGDETFDIVVTAYDNDGDVLGTKEYTAETFIAAVSNSMYTSY